MMNYSKKCICKCINEYSYNYKLDMQQQGSLNKFSEAEHRDLRKRDLHKRFAQNRRVIQLQHRKEQSEEFNRIYPMIDSTNFKDLIDFFKKYVYNEQYNYMLVLHAQIVVDYLIDDPKNEDGLFILEALSYFEEIQIANIEELAKILLQNMHTQSKKTMNIIANLLDIGHYCQNLRDELIDLEFIPQSQRLIQKMKENSELQGYITYLFTHICCCMMRSHPLVCPQIYQTIINSLISFISQSGKQQIVNTLQIISHSFEVMPIYASILYEGFGIFCERQYELFNAQIISFLHYCARSEIKMRIELLKLLAVNLKNSKNQNLFEVLFILKKMSKDGDEMGTVQIYLKFQQQKIILNILRIYEHVSLSLKIVCLDCISHIMREFALDLVITSKKKQNNVDVTLAKCFADLSTILFDNMQQLSSELKQLTVQIFIIILQTFYDESIQYDHSLMRVFQKNKFFIMVNSSYLETSSIKQLANLIDKFYIK